MKKYVFLILISCILILTAILAGLSLGPASSYLENKTGLFQGAADSPAVVLPQSTEGLRVEYVSDQAIRVPLPDARLQEQLELALGFSSFSAEEKGYEDVAERVCPATSIAPAPGSPAQALPQLGEAELPSQTQEPYVIYIRRQAETARDYTLVVGQEELQAGRALACATAEETEVEW